MKHLKNIFLLLLGTLLLSMSCGKDGDEIPFEPEVDIVTEKTDFERDYTFVISGSFVQDRNFYLLTLLQDVSGVNTLLNVDEVFKSANEKFFKDLKELIENPGTSTADYAKVFEWTQENSAEIAGRLQTLAKSNNDLSSLVVSHARPSGVFQRYVDVADERLIYFTWLDAVKGMDNIINEYIHGETPTDEVSDGPAFELNSEEYLIKVKEIAESIYQQKDDLTLFFEPSLRFVLDLLRVNNREEAGSFEPLEEGENKAALDYLPTIDWDKYKYSVMLLLGDSPNSPGDSPNISAGAKDRVKIAAERYHNGMVPLIIISGADMYPPFTPYFEAIEMKKYMVANFNVPEKAIIAEPHGRQTTKNLRDGSRLIIRYGIPVDKMGIITTSKSHSEYVESAQFYNRCVNDFGYMPVELKDRISIYDIEFLPKYASLFADSMDPLDP